ncbi:MAG: hypothetical protein M0Z25_05790 [Nitrospiraceae bacterium]|nr:hypothetical protein [Nitrospiraceae bacterium]
MRRFFSRSQGADRIWKLKDPVRFFFFSSGRSAKRSGLSRHLIFSVLPFLLGLSFLLSPDLCPADSSPVLELSGGEMVFSQQAAFYDAMVGGLFPLEGLRALASGETPAFLHLFVAGNVITFNQPAVSPDQSVDGLTRQSYIGGVGAVGLRIPASWGFWEGDVGGAYFNVDQTLTPVSTVGGVYLQTELLLDRLGPGSLDLFGSYIGSINYLLGEGRYLVDAGNLFEKRVLFYAGPEVIGQGNDSYQAVQAGGVLSAEVPSLHTIFSLEAGVLNSSVWPGIGGYEGFSFYYSY